MKVVILGAGTVGFNIARYLATRDNDVTVVDQSEVLLKRISDTIDIQPVVGYASHPDVLAKAGVEEADLLIALTLSDEVNIVACEVVNSLYTVPKKIARIRNQSYLSPALNRMFGVEKIAIDYIISPESEVAKTICRSLRVMGAFDVKSLWDEEIKIFGLRCDTPSVMLNTPLRLLPGLFPRLNFMVACLYREGELFIPSGNDQILLHDEVYLVATPSQIHEIMNHFHYNYEIGKRALIIGGGSIGLTLAMEIEENLPQVAVKIIERDPIRAEYIARHLREAEVMCGDGLDVDVLKESGVQDMDTVISVTEDDKVNILSSLLVKREGARRTITLLNNMDYSSLVTSLGIDAIVSPHAITVSTILQYIRQGHVQSVHSLKDGEVEIIETEVQETSNIIGLTIEDINIKGKIQIASLLRQNDMIILPSKTTIRAGDRLILVVAKDVVEKIERLFAPRPGYL